MPGDPSKKVQFKVDYALSKTTPGHLKPIPDDYCVYFCEACRTAGLDHRVIHVPDGVTGKYSDWGPGLPTTRMECTTCGRWSGPWVSAKLVGDGW